MSDSDFTGKVFVCRHVCYFFQGNSKNCVLEKGNLFLLLKVEAANTIYGSSFCEILVLTGKHYGKKLEDYSHFARFLEDIPVEFKRIGLVEGF